MLSRVAERVYWASRYLERIYSTARLVSTYQALLYDLPKTVELSWYNLILINDLQVPFGERYSKHSERNVVKFLLADDDNPSALVNSIRAARENVRTTRDVVPEEAWELICELSIYVSENLEKGLSRGSRFEFLDEVSKGCLQINGLLFATMPHDATWQFLSLGRRLERADMTSRYLEAGVTAILPLLDDDSINSQQVIWGSVLRSLSATQHYLRTIGAPITGEEVVTFLMHDPAFPKSIHHCIESITVSCTRLPRSEPVVKKLKEILKELQEDLNHDTVDEMLLQKLNQLQILLNTIHFTISHNWFPADP